jgi:ankyrin repeat protein
MIASRLQYCALLLVTAVTLGCASRSPLLLASARSTPQQLNQLLTNGEKLNSRDALGNTAAHYAARGFPSFQQPSLYRRDNLKLLLDAGIPANVLNVYGQSLLHAALTYGNSDDASVVEYLLRRGAPADLATTSAPAISFGNPWPIPPGTTPLMLAARCRSDDSLKLLLERGANVNARNAEGWTPLLYAVRTRDTTYARRLLNAGATPSRAVGSAVAMHATAQVYLLAGEHAATTQGSRELAIEYFRVAADSFDNAANAFSADAGSRTVGLAAANALLVIGATKLAQLRAQEQALYSRSGRGSGVVLYQTSEARVATEGKDPMSAAALSEGDGARMLLACATSAKDATELRACVPV